MKNACSRWYSHRWPWFIVALLGGSVAGSIGLLVLAINTQDAVVHDHYRDAGKGVDRELGADLLARKLGQRAELELDSLTGEVRLRLRGASKPERLALNLVAPAQAERDLHLALLRGPSAARGITQYRGQFEGQVTGRRLVELLGESPEGTWRIYEQEWLLPDHPITLGDDALSGALAP